MSDDIELNLKTLEPEEKEEEEFSEGEHSCGQRVPMHKPAILVQYWINTGNTPYKLFLDKKELSESGSSLSEEEITSPSYSLLSNMVNESNHKHEDDTSFSSVDTAAYILSNANVTKKADTIAIIEGAKSNGVKSSRDNYTEAAKTVCNDRTNCTETMTTNHLIHNENSNDVLHNFSSIENVASDINSDTNNHLVNSTVISVNTIQPNVSSQNSLCDTMDKADVLSASQKNVDLCSIDDIVNIFQQFNEVSKRLSVDDKSNSTLSERETLKKRHNSSEEQISVNTAEENINKDATLVSFHRKKLYTGRNSPVDLILIEKERDSSLSDMNKPKSPNILSLHPALDPDNSNRSESLVYKDKSKRYLSSKKILGSKKFQAKKRQKRSSVSNKNITNDEIAVTNNSTSDSNIDYSLQNLLSSNNADKRSSNSLIKDCNDIDVSMENVVEKNPIVYLEKITFFKEKTSESVKNKDITQENNTDNNTVVSRLSLYEDLESADSDQSTILICECNNNVSQDSLSNSSFHLRLSTEDDCSIMNTKKRNDKLTNMKNCSYMDKNKKPLVILERLSQSIIERYKKPTQVLSIDNNTGKSKKLLNKSKINSFNTDETNTKNGVKLREMKVMLDRLPADTYLKRSSNATSISCSAVKDNISQDTIVSNNKRKFRNTIRNSNNENKRITRAINKINNNYSLRIHARSKINDDEMNNTANDVAQHDNRVSDETESNSTSQYRNHNGQVRTSQDKRRKFSILGFISSDEDDFVRLIRPEKKFKTLTDNTSKTHVENDLHDEATLISANEDKHNSNRNMNSTIYSSKQGDLKNIDTLIRGRDRQNKVKLKSSDSNVMSVYSFPMHKSKKFSPFSRGSNQCDNIMRNSNGRSKKYRFSNIKDISNTSEKHLNKVIKKNGINCSDATCVTLFQTKAFNTESSDSDNRSNNNITFIRKSLRVASTLDRTRFNGRANKKELRNASHVKIHVNKQSNSLNSPIERHEATNKIYSVKKRLRSASGTTTETNKVDKEFNINLRTTTRSMSCHYITSNVRNALVQKCNTILNASLLNNSPMLLRNKQIPEKPNLKNSQANQQRDVKSPVKKLVTFQTKSYYDSDSSGYL